MPEHSAMAPKPCTPVYFGAFLARSWAEGTTKVRHLFSDIRHRGYTGSDSHLSRFLALWRNCASSGERGDPSLSAPQAPSPPPRGTLHPTTLPHTSPLTPPPLSLKP